MDANRTSASDRRKHVRSSQRRCCVTTCILLLACTTTLKLAKAEDPTTATAAEIELTAITRQLALDRAGFSPGLIDGRIGRKTQIALQAFQAANRLTASGEFDAATVAALGLADLQPLRTYAITADDLAQVGDPIPADWNARAKLRSMSYESLSALLAERGHCTLAALDALNPGRKLDRLRPGATVTLPNVDDAKLRAAIAALEVDLTEKVIRARDTDGRVCALLHCSIARLPEDRPTGETTVAVVAMNPTYTFRPEMWPEVKNVDRVLTIPAGPRNPVGLCWIGLERPGYGIHGTPNPELIGKTGSHGCIRLTNWDAQRLGRAVRVGTPVRFIGE